MKITIDGAGRIVVPKKIRERFNLTAGAVLEVEAESDGIHLKTIASVTSMVKKKGFWVHHGTESSDIDIARFIASERDSRSTSQVPVKDDR
jgi:AbrB family looped-hinge helix DNA binding protein